MSSPSLKWEKINDARNKGKVNPFWNKVWYKQKLLKEEGEQERYTVLSARYKAYMSLIDYYDVKSDDIWICTYPKSGTTWAQEMIWMINNDYNFELANQVPLSSRSPTLRKM